MPDTEKREEGKGLPKGPSGTPASGTDKGGGRRRKAVRRSAPWNRQPRPAARSPAEKGQVPRLM